MEWLIIQVQYPVVLNYLEQQVVFNVYGVHVVIIDDVGNTYLNKMIKTNVIMEYLGKTMKINLGENSSFFLF